MHQICHLAKLQATICAIGVQAAMATIIHKKNGVTVVKFKLLSKDSVYNYWDKILDY